MLFRRIEQHVRDQNWFAVGIDFCIVVIGVFIGIQVANWNEARVNRDTEATYLDLLQRDLQTTRQTVEGQIVFEDFQLKLANSAAPIIESPTTELRQQKLGIILTRLGGRRTLRVDSPTFLDLQSSGRLGLISDPDLRNAILSYFFDVQRLEAVIDKNNATFVDEGFNSFLDDYAIGFWTWDDEIMGAPPPGLVSAILSEQRTQIDAGLTDVGTTQLTLPPEDLFWNEVRARLAKRAGISSANRRVAISLRDETVLLEEKISAYLERSRK